MPSMPFITTRFISFVKDKELFEPENSILLAVSGGKDSVFMTHLFKEAGFRFGIAHCNFRLRGSESDKDASFTEELAKQFGVPFYSTEFETLRYSEEHKISVQMAARELRYAWFEEISINFGYDFIALAQHRNDSSETILLNLTRGTGIAGLHGILPKRAKLIRPLLFLDRDEIDELVASASITYREDQSNSSLNYARNKIRQLVIPVLKELNPSLEHTFEKNAKHFEQVEEFLAAHVTKLRKALFKPVDDGFVINITDLELLHPLELLLFELFKPFKFTEETLTDLVRSWKKHAGRRFYSATHQLIVDRNVLMLSAFSFQLSATSEILEEDPSVKWNSYLILQKTIYAKNQAIDAGSSRVTLNYQKLAYPLHIRSWQKGDYFYPLGMKGKKKISDFFISLKIPRHQKGTIPLLINGNGDILWVAGYRMNEHYKVEPDTEKVAIFEISKS